MSYAFPTAILERMESLGITDADVLYFAGITWDPKDCMPEWRSRMELLKNMVDKDGVWLKHPPKGDSRSLKNAALCWRAMDAALTGCFLPEWRPEAGAGLYRNPSKYDNQVACNQRVMLFGMKLAIFASVVQKMHATDAIFSEPLVA